jgi:hypothetical protein
MRKRGRERDEAERVETERAREIEDHDRVRSEREMTERERDGSRGADLLALQGHADIFHPCRTIDSA